MKSKRFNPSYLSIAKLMLAMDANAKVHAATGLPRTKGWADTFSMLLWTEARKAGLVSEEWPATEYLTKTVTVHPNNDDSGYVYVPVLIYSYRSNRNLPDNHPFMRLLRRMASRIDHVRSEVKYAVGSRRNAARTETQPALTISQRIATKPLTPESFRYDRALGIELELVSPLDESQITFSLPFWARRASDGSIRSDGYYAHEIRALFPRSQMEPRLHRLCNLLNNMECKVNKSCGFHVHLDMRGESSEAVHKRAKIVDAWLYAMQELVPASRRTNDYCKFGISTRDRYHAVNYVAFSKYNTLEIRLHSGTVDYTKIIAWIRLCELLAAMRHKPKSGGCIATLEQLPLASHDLAYWRARHQQINPTMYSSNATSEQE